MSRLLSASEYVILQKAVDTIIALQGQLGEDERKEMWEDLQEGYCPHCGSSYLPCYCTVED